MSSGFFSPSLDSLESGHCRSGLDTLVYLVRGSNFAQCRNLAVQLAGMVMVLFKVLSSLDTQDCGSVSQLRAWITTED